ncbi:hypothetical protein C8J57DRAFT_697772 [Mycena rebaudengoi]|nr:hypothetical protein C8J57DRAFT_697772 [Mycena rebaudengoi]
MSFKIDRRENITEVDIDEAVGVALRANFGELATTSMTGGDETLKGELFRAMIRAANIAGEIYLATDPSSNKIVAFTLWFPPGTSLFDSEEQRALGFDDFMNKISPETKAFWENANIPLVEEFLTGTIGPNGVRDSQYCNLLATDPEFQRRGIATMLLKTIYDKFNENETRPMLALCAANHHNARFYESCGYKNRGEFFLDAPTGQPTSIL